MQSAQTASNFIHFNSNYVSTLPGVLKIACVLLVFVGILFAQFSGFWNGYSQFFKVIAWIDLIFTGILFLLYLFYIPYVYNGLPWLQIEFFFSVASTICLALASLLLIINASGVLFVAACLGFLAMFVYAYDALSKYKQYTSGPANVIA